MYSHCSNNVVIGETVETTYPVQTPAVNFTLENDSVSNPHTLVLMLHNYCLGHGLSWRTNTAKNSTTR